MILSWLMIHKPWKNGSSWRTSRTDLSKADQWAFITEYVRGTSASPWNPQASSIHLCRPVDGVSNCRQLQYAAVARLQLDFRPTCIHKIRPRCSWQLSHRSQLSRKEIGRLRSSEERIPKKAVATMTDASGTIEEETAIVVQMTKLGTNRLLPAGKPQNAVCCVRSGGSEDLNRSSDDLQSKVAITTYRSRKTRVTHHWRNPWSRLGNEGDAGPRIASKTSWALTDLS